MFYIIELSIFGCWTVARPIQNLNFEGITLDSGETRMQAQLFSGIDLTFLTFDD